ncbi:DUF1403 family protein [Rhizobiaceae sp. 2RAB30]
MPVPSWLQRSVPDAQSLAGKAVEDVALATGAAVGALDAIVRRQERWAGAWRQRLALSAAAVAAKQGGRIEGEAALRDAVLLTNLGDNAGPAGRMLLAWRRLADRSPTDLLTERSLVAVLEQLGYGCDNGSVSDLAVELRQLSAHAGTVATLTGAVRTSERHGFGRILGAWLADALLAQRLGWARAVPLLGTEVVSGIGPGRSPRSAIASPVGDVGTESDRTKNLLAAQARAALRAIDLSAELGRRAERLHAVAPKLRAKAADIVVEKLLSSDAIVASEKIADMSDRGLRRLFDRLLELGAVRELSGRPTFRIYGL